VTQNTAVSASDFSPYCITAPVDPRLPNGGGYQVCGLYDVNPDKFGQVSNLVTQSSNFGKQVRRADFFAAGINTKFANGMSLAGGVDTGRTVNDVCFNVSSPGVVLASGQLLTNPHTATTIDGAPTCRVVTGFAPNTQVKINGSMPLPGDFVVSATLQNLPGENYLATYSVPTAQVRLSLGRDLSGGTRNVNVPLIRSNSAYEDRRTQLDMRFTKIVRMGRTRLQANLDIFNALNASSILELSSTYGAQWRQPSRILDPRMLQLSARFDF
jgi:hypothetical protein